MRLDAGNLLQYLIRSTSALGKTSEISVYLAGRPFVVPFTYFPEDRQKGIRNAMSPDARRGSQAVKLGKVMSYFSHQIL